MELHLGSTGAISSLLNHRTPSPALRLSDEPSFTRRWSPCVPDVHYDVSRPASRDPRNGPWLAGSVHKRGLIKDGQVPFWSERSMTGAVELPCDGRLFWQAGQSWRDWSASVRHLKLIQMDAGRVRPRKLGSGGSDLETEQLPVLPHNRTNTHKFSESAMSRLISEPCICKWWLYIRRINIKLFFCQRSTCCWQRKNFESSWNHNN